MGLGQWGHRKESQGLTQSSLLKVSELKLEMGLIYILQVIWGKKD